MAETVAPNIAGLIEVVDLVWKGLRHSEQSSASVSSAELKSLTWFGRDCDKCLDARGS